jgi:peptidoglycan lytic transglycosylase B
MSRIYLAHISKRLSLGLALLMFGGCANQAEKPLASTQGSSTPTIQAASNQSKKTAPNIRSQTSVGGYHANSVSGDYAGYQSVNRFIDEMVQKHGFDRAYLNGLFSQAKRKQWTLDYLAKSDKSLKSKPSQGSWSRYRAKFLDSRHINSGVSFWREHRLTLQRASKQYGVPAEYILGIMAVETTFGSYVGSHRVIDALTTLSFDYQRRGEYFRGELENFLLMSRSEHINPAKPVGSFAGAMGLGQFMPSSFLEWAVDFNADGHRDLWDPEDSIGSVANYFSQHGWQPGKPVVSSLRGNLSAATNMEPGLDNLYSLNSLQQAGLLPTIDCHCDDPLRLIWLRHNSKDEYLLGYPNFYVITRYNHSTHYAMAVHELAKAIKSAYSSSASR